MPQDQISQEQMPQQWMINVTRKIAFNNWQMSLDHMSLEQMSLEQISLQQTSLERMPLE